MNELASGILIGLAIAIIVMLLIAALLGGYLNQDEERVNEVKRQEKSKRACREIKIDDKLKQQIQNSINKRSYNDNIQIV